ncbi:hypothetical protein KSP40_PGU008244 [Platanthera guangdongensis]|uniref:Uncharacterized protein n=1 Tax=Platanthera guangdongensis TaxID=2320717 RepID=A0ABR2MCB7_9ASPA
MPFQWPNPQIQNPNTPSEPKPYKTPFSSKSLNPLAPLLSNPTAASFKNQLEITVGSLTNQARRALQLGFSSLLSPPTYTPFLARVSPIRAGDRGRSMPEAVEERLSGVPVYALSNAAEEFVLVSGVRTKRSLGLVCFKKGDAEALLHTLKSMNRDFRRGSRVVAIALNKVSVKRRSSGVAVVRLG